MIITELARAKINVALHVIGRRADGYHELDSIVAFAETGDVLTFRAAADHKLTVTGPFAHAVPAGDDNIILKAARAFNAHLRADAPGFSAHITLEKRLPVASGMGGGSADAAATLRGLNQLTGAGIDIAGLERIALEVGADVPVCIGQRQVRMRGIGEVLQPFVTPLAEAIVLVNPGVELATRDVFAALGLAKGASHLNEIDPARPLEWRNDLTAAAMALEPKVRDVIAALEATGACDTVRMSGSGATCFGLCRSLSRAENTAKTIAAVQPGWWCAASLLAG